jgi:capsular polysaccharide biosynthesis protein
MSCFHRESLELLDVDLERCHEIYPDDIVELEELLIAPPATVDYNHLTKSKLQPNWTELLVDRPFAGPFKHSPAGLHWLARKMVSAAISYSDEKLPSRIFVTRRRTSCRRLNDHDLDETFIKHGFETVELEDLSFSKQVRLFHGAEYVIAPHGAALSNLIFCKPGTKVLEIFEPSSVRLCYWAISDTFELDYNFLIGSTVPSQGMDPDIHLDPQTLDRQISS